MPLHDFLCPSCSHRESDRFWASWQEAAAALPLSCPECGESMTRLASRCIVWGPAVEIGSDGEILIGAGRAPVPGKEIFAGTPLAEAAAAGETVNPHLPPDHPGYYKRATGYREHVDLGS